MKQAFTLIELLVVVLIIGILAAVALPQYQKAVIRSRYSTVKNLAQAIYQAQQVHHLANGVFSAEMADLGVCTGENSQSYNCIYNWGKCELDPSGQPADRVLCNITKINMGYRVYFATNKRVCIAYNKDLTSAQNAVCKAETGATEPAENGSNYYGWTYTN